MLWRNRSSGWKDLGRKRQFERMKRYLQPVLAKDLARKMVFLTGPRQVGKTTLSRQLMERADSAQYFNYDVALDRKTIQSLAWNPSADLLVFDELHKMRQWKSWLKGVYDGKPAPQRLLVTGSARLDYLKKSGDSLAGRYLGLRLHPISVAEWCSESGQSSEDALTHLMRRGGFPEAVLANDDVESDRWRSNYLDGLIREDILEFSRLHEVNTMRVLVDMLRERVGSVLSVASLARDLGAPTTTINRYLQILEALYVIFTVRPWHKNVSRSLVKSPKVYFYDTGMVRGNDGPRYENLVAGHLLKWVHYQQDVLGKEMSLHYIRTRDEAEVDFCLVNGGKLTQQIECKLSDTKRHPALNRFARENPEVESIQLVRHLHQTIHLDSLRLEPAAAWLNGLI
jgi:uncharacterized protein